MSRLVLIRHGQSQWNLENRFTGWADVDLTDAGISEARQAGAALAAENIDFDEAFTSFQKRAIKTLWIMLEVLDQMYIPVTKDWRLNERHYGALTGLNKDEMRIKYGAEQVHLWRRSFDIPPPSVDESSPYHFGREHRYQSIEAALLPVGESLALTTERVLPCFEAAIIPKIQSGATLIISAHGNSLRALLKYLFKVSDQDIAGYEFPTGNPLLIELDHVQLAVRSARYLDVARAQTLPPLDG